MVGTYTFTRWRASSCSQVRAQDTYMISNTHTQLLDKLYTWHVYSYLPACNSSNPMPLGAQWLVGIQYGIEILYLQFFFLLG